ncbi:tripartite tricarboxylate transporter substrate binding protein [Limnohabitans sp.]|uniref:tripartite tricarboxylate transporter substrate binding protein n=1 Tax=Limnohabitans sp. TaxID=1907725 RepID=UPI0038B997A7
MKMTPWLLCSVMLCTSWAQAQTQTAHKDYPNHPIRMVVPYVAGGPMDFIGRALNQKMAPSLGQNFVIDNRAGAGGAIGTGVVAKSAPDGYTLLNTSSSHASLPVVSPGLSYDPIKDFTPITLVANSVGFVVAVGPSVKASTLQEFIADAKARPEKLNYGSGGVGNVMQFAAEFFNTSAGTKINHVPYKGVGEAITDLMAGRIDVCIGSATALLPLVKSGKLRALAITGKTRWAMMPDVPTVDEAGVRGFVYTPWYGLWYPAGTPTEYVTRMRQEVVKALDDPEVKRSFAEQGYVTVGSTPAEFAKVIADEIEANKRLATKINFAAP